MFQRVTVGVSDLEASRRFYDAVFEALFVTEPDVRGELVRWERFAIDGSRPATVNGHVALQAITSDVVGSWHAAALAGGGTDNGEPGPRPQYGPRIYAAYALDPDGVNLEATFRPMSEWPIDHVVLGVKDLAESKRFYTVALAPLGRGMIGEFVDAVCFGAYDGALWIADRDPTTGIELAVASVGASAVDRFAEALAAEGYELEGEPGELPEYGEGTYAACAADPDGNRLVAVCMP